MSGAAPIIYHVEIGYREDGGATQSRSIYVEAHDMPSAQSIGEREIIGSSDLEFLYCDVREASPAELAAGATPINR
jgi:hypothetical protein